ncbi:endolytic transglycosylase MltG [Streptosporangium roseum]|uniref:Endolytic murein transglycosylase n=1 Tax=Streptosporangium roseum (strain ATCC 12428 / DSM 43021 / JCM 3005 / KCTC 9067 / NCIMB 10171 / NRRL 2505 / NI 9100) TaxID=479432 RepID=D2AVH2_STRRD|nr:endolytic transglycosylase MltG [Streptosporangium roseum]ACZ88823.1 aminodeoxychorismate lyase [Streptosporangium roseum DSM 43021]
MNDLDMDFLVGDDDGRSRRGSRTSSGSGGRRGRRRRRRRNRGGFLAPMLAVIVLLGGIGAGGFYGYTWLRDAMTVEDYTGQGAGEVVVEIKTGQSASDVARTLQEQGVVKSAEAFVNAAAAADMSASLQPGEYTLRKQMSAAAAVKLLDPDKRLRETVTLKEGLRLSDTLTQLAKQTGKPLREFQRAARDGKALGLPSYARGKLEGYAFPATYEISPKMEPVDILTAMVDRFHQTAGKDGLEKEAKALGHTPHEIMTIASIVQAESGSVEDMGKVARVIYNRLDGNPPRKLEMDSTVMYGLNKYGVAATNADLESTSPYNTYAREGLPPGPIANPGDHAIQAALNPTKGDWIFFVTTDTKRGITKFTASEAEFFRFKAEFEKNQAGG